MESSESPTARALPSAVGIAALAVLGLALHLPRLFRPLGLVDACGGAFYGVFFRNYDAWGFSELRGIPLWRQLYPLLELAEPYLNHPPGLWWLMYALGGSEWAMRLPSIAGAIVTAACLFVLLRPRLGAWPSWSAGALLLGTPVMTVYCQITPDTVTSAFGLTMWIATLRVLEAEGRARLGWHAVQAGCAVAGTWIDWSFGMFCFGLVAIAWQRSIARMARALVVPGAFALVSAILVGVWQRWGLESPLVRPPTELEDPGFWAQIERTIQARPPIGESLARFVYWQPHIATLPLAITAIVGMPLLWRRAARIATGLLIAGICYFGLFANHALTHPQFYVYLVAFMAASAGALGSVATPGLRGPAAAGLGLVCVLVWVAGFAHARQNDTDFHRDIGRVLCDAAVAPSGEKRKVTTNFAPVYAYYVDDADVVVMPPISDVAALQLVQKDRQFAYLLVVVDKPSGVPLNDRDPALEAWLAQFPRRRVPELEVHLFDSGYGWDWKIREAWLVEIPRAE